MGGLYVFFPRKKKKLDQYIYIVIKDDANFLAYIFEHVI